MKTIYSKINNNNNINKNNNNSDNYYYYYCYDTIEGIAGVSLEMDDSRYWIHCSFSSACLAGGVMISKSSRRLCNCKVLLHVNKHESFIRPFIPC